MSTLTERHSDTPYTSTRTRARGQRIKRCDRRDLKRLFLHRFARTGNVRQSCQALKLGRATFYRWLRADSAFSAKYHEIERRIYPSPMSDAEFERALARHSPRFWSERQLIQAINRIARKRQKVR